MFLSSYLVTIWISVSIINLGLHIYFQKMPHIKNLRIFLTLNNYFIIIILKFIFFFTGSWHKFHNQPPVNTLNTGTKDKMIQIMSFSDLELVKEA